MALATTTDLVVMFPELTGVDSGTLQLYLDDAQQEIELQGVSSNHAQFSRLQRYKTGSSMSSGGYLNTDKTGESVADVSVSWGGGGSSLDGPYTNKWERLYLQLLNSILGMDNRIL